jgi:hypothetical protein
MLAKLWKDNTEVWSSNQLINKQEVHMYLNHSQWHGKEDSLNYFTS